MRLRDRTIGLLSSKAALKIEFTFNGVYFVGRYFNLVSSAIMSKWVGGKGVGFRLGQVPKDAGAAYDPDADMIEVLSWGFGVTPYDRQALVHESFHAWRDIWGAKVPGKSGMVTTLALMDEAMAYLAGVLFHIHDTTPVGAAPKPPSWMFDNIYAEAYLIAESIWNTRGGVVSDEAAASLMEAVKEDPSYTDLKENPKTRYHNNGV
jgi:hypothetical protein